VTLSGSPAGFGTHLVMTSLAVGVTAAAVYLLGLTILPGPTTPLPVDGAGSTFPTVDDLSGSQAILVVSGEEEGRLLLDRLTVNEYNEGAAPGDPLQLSLTYRTGNASLLITAREITGDTPASGEAASAVLGLEGANYFGTKGNCAVSLQSVDYVVLEPMPGVLDGVPRGMPIPVYAGTVDCESVRNIHSGALVDIYAVFQYLPET
jgi:hypothetical protein